MKFTKPFYGCRDGEIYPEQFQAGDECPPELEAAAAECGAVQGDEQTATRGPGRRKAEAADAKD